MRSTAKYLIFILLLFLGIWVFGRLVLPLILPFLLGTGLALAAEPLVNLLCGRLRLPRGAGAGIGVSIAFLLISGMLLSLAALLLQQLKALAGILPDLEAPVVSAVSLVKTRLLELANLAPLSIRPLLRGQVADLFSGGAAFLGKAAAWVLSLAGGFLTHIPGRALSLITAVVSGFMISAKLPGIRSFLQRHLNREQLQPALDLLRRIRSTLGKWILAELKLALITWLFLSGGLILLAVPHGPLWAAAIALLDALPILGTGAVLIPWALICFLAGNRARGLGLLGVYLTVSLTRTVLEPRLVGKHLGLDPLITLAALYAGFRIWGFGGMLLAPLLAVAAGQLFPREISGS